MGWLLWLLTGCYGCSVWLLWLLAHTRWLLELLCGCLWLLGSSQRINTGREGVDLRLEFVETGA